MNALTINLTKPTDNLKTAWIYNSKTGDRHPIDGVIRIGRNLTNEIPVLDPSVSAIHCQVERRPYGFFLRDMGSTNGTWINQVRVNEAALIPGTVFKIGKTEFCIDLAVPGAISTQTPEAMKSKNTLWQGKLDRLASAAKTDLPILLLGESGTGKDVLAQSIHAQSVRRDGPFVAVNCSALAENLIESELFGHVKGSFTGAVSDRKGAFESARGGTLFLDEIGDLPLSMQPKLLRALENNEIRAVGSDKSVKTDVRIIAATHLALPAMVQEKKFRADLYYRINVINVRVPSLKDRVEDFETFFYHFARENGVSFSYQAIEIMKRMPWPGNIRELKNAIARAKALYGTNVIQPDELDGIVDKAQRVVFNPEAQQRLQHRPFLVSKDQIVERLIINNGNQRQTAIDLKIPKSTLNDRIKLLGIDIKSLRNMD